MYFIYTIYTNTAIYPFMISCPSMLSDVKNKIRILEKFAETPPVFPELFMRYISMINKNVTKLIINGWVRLYHESFTGTKTLD